MIWLLVSNEFSIFLDVTPLFFAPFTLTKEGTRMEKPFSAFVKFRLSISPRHDQFFIDDV